jgi:hypothetical protein
VKALGRGSIASFIKVALEIIWALLWFIVFLLGSMALAYGLALLGVQFGWFADDPFAPGAGYGLERPQVAIPVLAAACVAVAGGLVIVGRLKALFASFTSGEPFRAENAGHLRVIWITLAIMELARMGLSVATSAVIAAFGWPDDSVVRVETNFAVSTWVAIVILIVLAEVFREGARMKAEQDLTI